MGKNEITKIKSDGIIKQSNNLIEAKYKLTTQEQKLVIAICSQLDKDASNFDTVRIKVTDFADFCKISKTNKYAEVRRIVMRLLDRKLLIHKNDGGWYGTHWLQSAEYLPSEGTIEYKIDDRLRPELLKLKSAYLSTDAKPLMEFRRDYAIRLYFILKKMLKIGEFEYKLDYFRERFALPKSYNLFANLKNKVLEPALAEINEKSDIQVEHEYIKDGRTYTKIHFIVTTKKAKEEEKNYEDKLEEAGQTKLLESASTRATRGLTDEQQEGFDSLVNRGVAVKKAKELAKTYDLKRIKDNIKLALKQKDTTRNIAGLIISFIANDTAGLQEIAKQAAKERIEKKQQECRQAYDLMHGTQTAANTEEEEENKTAKTVNVLTDLEVEFIKKKGEKAGKKIIEHMQALGLTIEEVRAGKRKIDPRH